MFCFVKTNQSLALCCLPVLYMVQCWLVYETDADNPDRVCCHVKTQNPNLQTSSLCPGSHISLLVISHGFTKV